MSLVNCNVYSQVTWLQQKEVTGFSNIYQGPDSSSFPLTYTIDDLGVDSIYIVEGTLAALATTTIDLTNLTDSFGDALVFTRLYGCQLEVTDAPIKFQPGATNAQVWFFGDSSSSVIVQANSCFDYFSEYEYTVDSTHKNLKLTNQSATTAATYKLIIVGGQGPGTTTTSTTTATSTT